MPIGAIHAEQLRRRGEVVDFPGSPRPLVPPVELCAARGRYDAALATRAVEAMHRRNGATHTAPVRSYRPSELERFGAWAGAHEIMFVLIAVPVVLSVGWVVTTIAADVIFGLIRFLRAIG
jgi:hypothetical protein